MNGKAGVLGIQNGGFFYGSTRVFGGVTFMLDDARTALVGENGVGKSTLLKCLTGELELTEGAITRSRSLRTGYLAQEIPHDLLDLTVRDVMARYLQSPDDEWQIDVLMADLGIAYDDGEKPFRLFSGGWQRIALIAAITRLAEPSLLILDEPTNHLDLSHLARLEDWLINHTRMPMLIVSHDRAFLDAVSTRTIFLRADGAHMFRAPFATARQELLQRDAAAAEKKKLEDKEVKRLQAAANRYKAWGVLNSSFHSKMKNTEKRIDKIKTEQASTYTQRDRDLSLSDADLSARTALMVENFTVETPDKARVLYTIDRLQVRPGDRIALLGENGTGKSTLLHILARAFDPQQKHYNSAAPVRYSPAVKLMYFDQRMQNLPLQTNLMDYIMQASQLGQSAAAALLAKAGFDYARAQSGTIGELSFGERSRLLFLYMKLLQPNFYLLDEPTNHLDIEGQEDLEEQLTTKDVSCIFVSHDRYFTRAAATRFVEIRRHKNGAKLVETDTPDEFFARQEAAA
jgi:ATPase subunit of ABC transporter with duplicated ATPase domains